MGSGQPDTTLSSPDATALAADSPGKIGPFADPAPASGGGPAPAQAAAPIALPQQNAQPQAASGPQPADAAGVAIPGEVLPAAATDPTGADGHTAQAGTDSTPAAIAASFTAAGHMPPVASSIATDSTAPVLGRLTTETTQPLALRIARAAQDGDKVLTVELHPADLGRVDVRLSFHADGMGVQMTIHRADTFDAFTRNRPGLEQQLAQAGINLGSGGLDLRAGQQQSGQQEAAPRSSQVRAPAIASAITPVSVMRPMQWAGNGLVNIIA